MKKYEFTEETIFVNNCGLHRIRALIDIPKYGVRKGDLGGFIEDERNLSHEDSCWVGDNAEVYNYARVFGDALVSGEASVYQDTKVFENAQVYDYAIAYNNAIVFGDSQVYGNAHISDRSFVYGHAQIFGKAQIFNNTSVLSNAKIHGCAVLGNVIINKDADITETSHVLIISPIGSRDDRTTFYKSENGIMVSCGCFNDTIEEFEKAVEKRHGINGFAKEYKLAIKLAKLRIGK